MDSNAFDVYQPGLSVDCVIFGFHENELRILLLKLKHTNEWALPGGFVRLDKDVDYEAGVVLEERTGLRDIFLKQFHLFGNVSRSSNSHVENLFKKGELDPELAKWFMQRFITLGYYALVEYSRVKQPVPDDISEKCEWCSLNQLPTLILDHMEIIQNAHEALIKDLNFHPIGIDLLPEIFTMPELQSLYETVLGKKLDRRNFRRKILNAQILIETEEKRTGQAHKSPTLYKFEKLKYYQLLESGLGFGN